MRKEPVGSGLLVQYIRARRGRPSGVGKVGTRDRGRGDRRGLGRAPAGKAGARGFPDRKCTLTSGVEVEKGVQCFHDKMGSPFLASIARNKLANLELAIAGKADPSVIKLYCKLRRCPHPNASPL